jgi:hypothetical protein
MIRIALLLIALANGLSACATAPPQRLYAKDGTACVPVGYWFNPYYMNPKTNAAC